MTKTLRRRHLILSAVGLLSVVSLGMGTAYSQASQPSPPLADSPRPTATQTEAGWLVRGTPAETPYYIVEATNPGPCVLIVGGMHGNEPAGAAAAGQIATWDIRCGKLVVVPRANTRALNAEQRRTPGLSGDEGDLNRAFPIDDRPRPGIAQALWKLVEEQNPNWVIDLHEGFDFHRGNPKSVGSSVIYSAQDRARSLAKRMIATVDATIKNPEQRFDPIETQVAGSLARAAWENAGIPSMIIETTTKLHVLSYRVRQHRLAIHTLLTELGMGPSPAHTVLGPHSQHKGLSVAVFDGSGTGKGSAKHMGIVLSAGGKHRTFLVGSHDIRSGALQPFDVIVHPGGSASAQAKALGEDGRRAVTSFVRAGGGYLGVCAGAYLAASNYEWSLGLIDANVIDREHWRRGVGGVTVEWTRSGRTALGKGSSAGGVRRFEVQYANGPILEAAGLPELADYEVLLWFRGEIANNGAPKGVMPGTPAIVRSNYGQGRTMACSPHPEKTEGLHALLQNSLNWLAGEQ